MNITKEIPNLLLGNLLDLFINNAFLPKVLEKISNVPLPKIPVGGDVIRGKLRDAASGAIRGALVGVIQSLLANTVSFINDKKIVDQILEFIRTDDLENFQKFMTRSIFNQLRKSFNVRISFNLTIKIRVSIGLRDLEFDISIGSFMISGRDASKLVMKATGPQNLPYEKFLNDLLPFARPVLKALDDVRNLTIEMQQTIRDFHKDLIPPRQAVRDLPHILLQPICRIGTVDNVEVRIMKKSGGELKSVSTIYLPMNNRFFREFLGSALPASEREDSQTMALASKLGLYELRWGENVTCLNVMSSEGQWQAFVFLDNYNEETKLLQENLRQFVNYK